MSLGRGSDKGGELVPILTVDVEAIFEVRLDRVQVTVGGRRDEPCASRIFTNIGLSWAIVARKRLLQSRSHFASKSRNIDKKTLRMLLPCFQSQIVHLAPGLIMSAISSFEANWRDKLA